MNDDRSFNVERVGSPETGKHMNISLDEVLKLFLNTFYAELPEKKN